MKNSHLIIIALLAGGLVLAGCNRNTPVVDTTADPGALDFPPEMTAEPELPQVHVTGVELGAEVDDEETVTEARTSFTADEDTIYVTVTTGSEADLPASGSLGVRWSYHDGQLVDERSIALSFVGEDVNTFRINNDGDWPTGGYVVEVSLEGEVVERREFSIE